MGRRNVSGSGKPQGHPVALAVFVALLAVVWLPAAAGGLVAGVFGFVPDAPLVRAAASGPGAVGGAEPAASGTGFPVTLTDDLGRSVTLTRPPQRIVSLAPSNTEILFAVGAGPQVVGVTDFCDFPPQVRGLPRVGGIVPGSLSVERVVSLAPDLVVSAGRLQQPVIDALARLGIPVLALEPRTIERVYENIRKVGQLTGHPDGAQVVVRTMQQRVEAVRRRIADLRPEERVRVFYEVWDNPLMTAGPGTFIGQLIELAGGINVFDDVGQDWPQVSLEELLRRDPDVILGPATHQSGLVLDDLRRRPGWQTLRAVRAGRVHVIEDNLISRPGPRLVEGLEQVARALYPERFATPTSGATGAVGLPAAPATPRPEPVAGRVSTP